MFSMLKIAFEGSKLCKVRNFLNEILSMGKHTPVYDYLINPRPRPGDLIKQGIHLRRKVHYEDKYTVKPLKITNLAGRDPNTGRVVVGTLGGGIKHKYHWVMWHRRGPTTADEPPIQERVIQMVYDGNRSAKLALVARGDEMKYYLAPDGLNPGDIIVTSSYIPKIPVAKPSVGDAYPLGALQVGTAIHNIERIPGDGGKLIHSAGTHATILKKINEKVHVIMPSKHEFVFDEKCMATVGRVSNLEHSSIPIGSAMNLRLLGFRPRSGLWQRKTGRFGRKIRAPKTIEMGRRPEPEPVLMLDDRRLV